MDLQVLTGEDEARLTFLAVRRWFGWSAGRLLVLDIGGGSLELASGIDEDPEVALSLPLGAGRMTRRFLPAARDGGRPDLAALDRARRARARTCCARRPRSCATRGRPTWWRRRARRSARWPGSPAPRPTRPACGRRGSCRSSRLDQLVGFVSRIESVGAGRAAAACRPTARTRFPAGAVVAAATMRALDVPCVRICPWALREGVILRRLDSLGGA